MSACSLTWYMFLPKPVLRISASAGLRAGRKNVSRADLVRSTKTLVQLAALAASQSW